MSKTEDIIELTNEELLSGEQATSPHADEPTEEELQEEDSQEEDLPEEEEELTEGEDEPDVQDKSDEQEAQSPAQQEKSLKMRRLLRNVLRDDDNENGSLKDMFNDIQISGEWLKRHWSFVAIVVVCMLLFVTNRYQAQQEIIEEARLKRELNDWKYIWLTQFSELTRSSRQSNIEEILKQRGDSTLRLSKDAPFIIKAK